MSEDKESANDVQLMRDYQDGDPSAFAALYERHADKLYGYLLNRLRDRELVEDVFQATFLKLHRVKGSYRANRPVLPWLFSVCHNVMVDSLRARGRLREIPTENLEELANATSYPEAPDSRPLVDIAELEVLPAAQREALQLRYVQELEFDEIAKRLETSPANVRQLVSRAARKLKLALSGKKGIK